MTLSEVTGQVRRSVHSGTLVCNRQPAVTAAPGHTWPYPASGWPLVSRRNGRRPQEGSANPVFPGVYWRRAVGHGGLHRAGEYRRHHPECALRRDRAGHRAGRALPRPPGRPIQCSGSRCVAAVTTSGRCICCCSPPSASTSADAVLTAGWPGDAAVTGQPLNAGQRRSRRPVGVRPVGPSARRAVRRAARRQDRPYRVPAVAWRHRAHPGRTAQQMRIAQNGAARQHGRKARACPARQPGGRPRPARHPVRSPQQPAARPPTGNVSPQPTAQPPGRRSRAPGPSAMVHGSRGTVG